VPLEDASSRVLIAMAVVCCLLVHNVTSAESISADNPFIAVISERIDVLTVLDANSTLQRSGILSTSH